MRQSKQVTGEQTEAAITETPKPLRDSHGGWLPGQSGNPKGRPPKSRSFRELASMLPEERKSAMIERMVRKVIEEGSPAAFRSVVETAEGKPAVMIVNNMPALEESPLAQALMQMRSIEGEAKLLT